MARTRSIKPEFWGDEKLSTISRDARLTFIGMWNLSDDFGVVKGHPIWLKNNIFPYDDILASEFQEWIAELEGISTILSFTASGEQYYYIRTFNKHQKINRPSQARNPNPPESLVESSIKAHGVVTNDSLNIHGVLMAETGTETETDTETETETEDERERKEKKSNKRKKAPLTPLPPDFGISDRVRAWAAEKKRDRLDEHLETFKTKCLAKGYQYADWDAAFMGAIRDNWAKIGGNNDNGNSNGSGNFGGSTGKTLEHAGRAQSDGTPWPEPTVYGAD